MASRLWRIYWDANCFIALLNWQATVDQAILDALRATFEDMLLGHLKIVTSDIFHTEVLGDNNSPAVAELLNDFLACKNFEIVAIRTEVYQLAGEMRQKCRDIGQNIETPDAIHIIMGNQAKCDEIWTTDKKVINKGKAGLAGNVRICLPYLEQTRLQMDI